MSACTECNASIHRIELMCQSCAYKLLFEYSLKYKFRLKLNTTVGELDYDEIESSFDFLDNFNSDDYNHFIVHYEAQ